MSMGGPNHVMAALPPCVYCGRPADSREDWFPRWFGRYRGVEVLSQRLCRNCNEDLGRTLDQSMSRESAEAVNRYALQIPGRHGAEVANVFYYKSQSAIPPVVATAPLPGLDFEPLREDVPLSNPPIRATQRQLVMRDAGGLPHCIPLPAGTDGAWLRAALHERGFADGRVSHLFCEPETADVPVADFEVPRWIRRALLSALPGVQESAREHGIIVYWLTKDCLVQENLRSEIRINLPFEYPRALAKIAFHYLLKMDRYLTGHEETFGPLREYIKHGTGAYQDFVDLNGRSFIANQGTQLRGIHHFLFLEADRMHRIKVRMQFFVKGRYQAAPIVVALGTDPYVRNLRMGHAVRVFDDPVDGFNGELIELETAQVDGLWGVLTPPWAIAEPARS